MKPHWKKLGQIYTINESNRHPKLASHASNPLPVHLEGNIYRVFYSGRDSINRSSVGAVDIDFSNYKVINDHYFPFFEHGPIGSFFADGVSIGNVYKASGVRYMLFMGWQNSDKSHWRGDIGRLVLTSNFTLELESLQPFMGCDATDPISLSYPWVHGNSSTGFNMWYGSTLSWDVGNGEMLHVIHHASSKDGHDWQRSGLAIPYKLGLAQAFSRPTVVQNENLGLEMWFSCRSGLGEDYRIGYASSENGINWKLDLSNAGITISDSGWDSEMIEYPFVFDHDGSRYMLYNGNSYGKTGIGLAVLDVT